MLNDTANQQQQQAAEADTQTLQTSADTTDASSNLRT